MQLAVMLNKSLPKCITRGREGSVPKGHGEAGKVFQKRVGGGFLRGNETSLGAVPPAAADESPVETQEWE